MVEMVSVLPLLSEFLGTFLLTLAIIASGGNPWVTGAALALVILLVGAMSGAYVNPAVSLAMYLKGALSAQELATLRSSTTFRRCCFLVCIQRFCLRQKCAYEALCAE